MFLRVCIFVCLCFCVCVFVFVFAFLRGRVFVWLCFLLEFARLCFSVFVVKTPPFAREAAEGGNGGSNPPGPHFTCI